MGFWSPAAEGESSAIRGSPPGGDRVIFTPLDSGAGILDEILPRRNEFQRPAVANIDQLVVIASGAIPVTDPFLIDRVVSIAEGRNCQPVICINKCDLDAAEELYQTYRAAGFPTLRVSAETGEGLEELSGAIAGKVSAFTGNSGVGKSSILNALEPGFRLQVGRSPTSWAVAAILPAMWSCFGSAPAPLWQIPPASPPSTRRR